MSDDLRKNQKNNIVLIGMSGAGKSTLGVILAKNAGMDFVDTDICIQQHTGKKLQDILDYEGIDVFLKNEEEVVSGLSLENHVIATGGSVIYSPAIMDNLRKNGQIIFLYVPCDELLNRLSTIGGRGIVMKPGYTYEDVYNERLELYREYSDYLLDCSGKTMEQCQNDLLDLVNQIRG